MGSVALLLAAVGCGGSSGGKMGTGGTGTTGKGGSSATGGSTGSGGASATGGSTGTGGSQASDYSFTVQPTALSLPLGGMQAVNITIDRDVGSATFNNPIMFTLNVPNSITGSGVTATFAPNPATAGTTTLTVNIGTTGITAGSYTLQVAATSGSETATVDLPLTVTAAASTLLVDNDASANNADPTDTTATASASDTLFTTLLKGESISYQTFIVPSGAPTTSPTTADLKNYSTIVWYTGNDYGGDDPTLSDVQEAILADWLDQGGHTLLMFSQDLVYDRHQGDWDTTAETDDFLATYIGAMGDADDGDLDHVTYTATGVTGTPFAGESFHVIKDSPIPSTGDVINPTTGTNPPVPLVTVMTDPDSTGTPIAAAIAVGRKKVGLAGTSTLVYVGMPIEDVLMTTGNNSNTQFFHAALVYAGLKTQ